MYSIVLSFVIRESVNGRSRTYFNPSRSDIGSLAIRKWLEKFSKGKVDWLDDNTYREDRTSRKSRLKMKSLVNRWENHSKDCKICREAITILTSTINTGDKLLVVWGCLALISSSMSKVFLTTLFAALFTFSQFITHKLRQWKNNLLSAIPTDSPPIFNVHYSDNKYLFNL